MENLNIYQKLAKIRKPVEVLQKNKKGYNYTYVTEDEILAKITGGMDKHGVSLIPSIVPSTTKIEPYHYTKTKVLKDGKVIEEHINEILVQCEMQWTWINNDNPEDRIVVPWTMVGQQADASQSFGSGLSYSSRYFLLKYFNVATSDEDPDNWRSKQKTARDMEDTEVAKTLIEQVHVLVQDFVDKNKERRPEVVEIVKKYTKRANGKATENYFNIKNPEIAAELLSEVTEKFGAKEE